MLLNKSFAATALDRASLPQANLNIAARVRTSIFPWTGQFSPQLVEELLAAYAPHGGVIFDPFVGSGTVLVEAARMGLAAGGSELNPAAMVLSRVFQMVNLAAEKRETVLADLRGRLFGARGPFYGPLFLDGNRRLLSRPELEAMLVRAWWESESNTVRDLAAALIVLCDFHRKHLNADTIHKTWSRLERTVRDLPESAGLVTVHHADARSLPIDSDSVDLVLTSPPYINVHNYHQKFRRSVEAMDWNVLTFARSEIGSNRQKPRKPLPHSHSILSGYGAGAEGNGSRREIRVLVDSRARAGVIGTGYPVLQR